MSELAFNANGESFEVPANVTGWRVRRMKPRGAPELVYGRDGRPLMIPIESEMEDLRDAVGQVGRYRLDPINDDGRTVEGVSAAYIQVVKPTAADVPVPAVAAREETDDPIREAMRLNTELARTVIDRFPEMMTAAADLVRAADGIARLPRATDSVSASEETDEDAELPTGFDLNTLVAQVVPMLVSGIASGKVKVPGLAAMFDWRKAAPEPDDAQPSMLADAVKVQPKKARKQKSLELPPLDQATMAHFIAVQAQLTPDEATLAREVAQSLEAGELRSWFEELAKLSVADAVAKVRSLITSNTKTGGAA